MELVKERRSGIFGKVVYKSKFAISIKWINKPYQIMTYLTDDFTDFFEFIEDTPMARILYINAKKELNDV